MNIAAWNIRGLNTSLKRTEIGVCTSVNRISIMGILETQIRFPNMGNIVPQFTKDWMVDSTERSASNIRIFLLWKSGEIDLEVLQKSAQMIHC